MSFKNYLLSILFTQCSFPKPLQTCISPAGFAATVVKDFRQLNNATALYSSFLFSTEVTDGIVSDHINQRTEKTLTKVPNHKTIVEGWTIRKVTRRKKNEKLMIKKCKHGKTKAETPSFSFSLFLIWSTLKYP